MLLARAFFQQAFLTFLNKMDGSGENNGVEGCFQ
jgi:hypothetical protein